MMQIGSEYEWIRKPEPLSIWGRLVETWHARGLVIYFAKFALLKIIRRTVLGWLWLPLRGLVPVLVGTLVLGGFLGVESKEAPYPIFLLSGLIPWGMFASTASWTVRCLELSRRYTRVAAFPRLVLPRGFSAPALLDTTIFIATYIGLLLWFWLYKGQIISAPGLGVILYLFLAWCCGLGIGLLLCIPGAQARDIRFSLGYMLSFLFALTPVTYPASMIPDKWSILTEINPLSGIVEGFRSALLGLPPPSFDSKAIAIVAAFALLLIGVYIFNRFERNAG